MADIIPNIVVAMPSQPFSLSRSFKPAAGGKVYLGQIDTDPTIPENQVQVYLANEDGTFVPVSQPVIINAGGFPVYNGMPARFVTVEGQSMAIYDSVNVLQFYHPNVLKYAPDQLRAELSTSRGPELVGVDLPAIGVSNLQDTIGGMQWQFGRSVLKSGGRNDKTTDNTALIQSMINSMDSGYIVIEYGCKWRSSATTFKDEVMIFDYSAYDDRHSKWGAQIRMHSQTADPGTKNANEFIYQAPYHPAIIVDNIDNAGIPGGTRCSFILRYKGDLQWRIGYGSSDTDRDFTFTDSTLSRRWAIAQSPGFEMSWNSGLVTGVQYVFGSKGTTDQLVRWTAPAGMACIQQFYSGSSAEVIRINYSATGEVTYTQNGSQTLKLGLNGRMYGNRYQTVAVPSTVSPGNGDSGTLYYNTSTTGGAVVTLPAPVSGLYFKGIVTAAQYLSFQVSSGTIRGFGSRVRSTTISDSIEIICLMDGTWEVIKSGSWAA